MSEIETSEKDRNLKSQPMKILNNRNFNISPNCKIVYLSIQWHYFATKYYFSITNELE